MTFLLIKCCGNMVLVSQDFYTIHTCSWSQTALDHWARQWSV